ncbi:hypothetical protein ACE2AJ_07955 [Aquihabitans daechungensis]|uniref:hypothetical protein n=1 Tax=Aquihabitans daechungensis TaxID=1052257 RepID=UPI003B9DEF7A
MSNSRATTTPGSPTTVRPVDLAARAVLGVLVAAAYLPPLSQVGLRTDLGGHLRLAESLAVSGRGTLTYPLFYQLTILVRALIPFELVAKIDPGLGQRQAIWDVAGVTTAVLIAIVLSQLVYTRIRRVGLDSMPDRSPIPVALGLSLATLLVAPLTFLSWSSHHLVQGYIGITAYENPTNLLAKPFALVLLVLVSAAFTRKADPRSVAALAAVSVLSMMAKPSFTICFLPAVLLMWVWRRRRERDLEWRLLLAGFVVPSITILGVQAALASGQGSISFLPFAVVSDLLDALGQPTPMFAAYVLASVAFPLATLVVATADERRRLALPWLAFAVAVGQFCLFGITGRTDYGDLGWGAHLCLFLLFVESCALLAGRFRTGTAEGGRRGWRGAELVLLAFLAAHLVCGLFLLYRETSDPAAWW